MQVQWKFKRVTTAMLPNSNMGEGFPYHALDLPPYVTSHRNHTDLGAPSFCEVNGTAPLPFLTHPIPHFTGATSSEIEQQPTQSCQKGNPLLGELCSICLSEVRFLLGRGKECRGRLPV